MEMVSIRAQPFSGGLGLGNILINSASYISFFFLCVLDKFKDLITPQIFDNLRERESYP